MSPVSSYVATTLLLSKVWVIKVSTKAIETGVILSIVDIKKQLSGILKKKCLCLNSSNHSAEPVSGSNSWKGLMNWHFVFRCAKMRAYCWFGNKITAANWSIMNKIIPTYFYSLVFNTLTKSGQIWIQAKSTYLLYLFLYIFCKKITHSWASVGHNC